MKYTKGPWRIGDAAHTIFGPPSGNPSPETIATLTGSNHRANARLIAAAPELLAVLTSLVKYVDHLNDYSEEGGLTLCDEYENAETAIKNAT